MLLFTLDAPRNRNNPHRVDDKVEPHEVLEALVVVAHHGAVVARVIQGQVLLDLAVLELAPVDQRRHLRHLGDHVQHVFVGVLPVLLFSPERQEIRWIFVFSTSARLVILDVLFFLMK